LADQSGDQWEFVKLNTEEYPEIAQQYGIQGIPNVKLFIDGEVADEFVGVLPEEMIVQWLQKAVPGKYHSQIQQAQQLMAEGHLRKAQKLLHKVIKAEPGNQEAAVWLAHTYLYSDYHKALEFVQDIRADSDYFEIAEVIQTFGTLFQTYEQPETLPDSTVKESYLAAIHELQLAHFEEALDRFIEVIRQKRSYDDDGARKACIAIFKFLGEEHELTRKYRREFSSALYV
jgi:putative thioredoxin